MLPRVLFLVYVGFKGSDSSKSFGLLGCGFKDLELSRLMAGLNGLGV